MYAIRSYYVSSIGGIDWLRQQGLRPNVDFKVVEYSSHGAAVAAVAAGAADAAVTTHTPLRQIPEDLRQQVRLLASDIRMPHVMTLALSSRLSISSIGGIDWLRQQGLRPNVVV